MVWLRPPAVAVMEPVPPLEEAVNSPFSSTVPTSPSTVQVTPFQPRRAVRPQ